MNDFDSNANWYLIQTKPRQEARAEEHLLRQQYECFRPLRAAPALTRSRRVADEDLFPGYLFIRLDCNDNWYPIRSTRGVCRVVAFGGMPCPVPDSLIASIRQRTQASAANAVRFTERAVILLNLLQREQRISLPRSSLQRLTAHAC